MAKNDEVICEKVMPDGYSTNKPYMTTSFSRIGAQYQITPEGRLVETCPSWADDMNETPIDMNMHGDVELMRVFDGGFRKYIATFVDGTLISIVNEERIAA